MPLTLILKIIVIVAAGLCFYASIFLYEDREKKLQNILEDLWIKIDDTQTQMLSKHTAFIKAISDLMTRGFDYIFGSKLISFQSVGVTLCFATAWIGIGTIVADIAIHKLDPVVRGRPYEFVTGEQIFSIALGFIYGLLPAYVSHRPWRFRWVSWQKIWGLGLLYILYEEHVSDSLYFGYIFLVYGEKPNLVILPILFFLCFAFPMFLFVLFTVLLRVSMKRIARTKSSAKVALIYLINCVPLLTFALMVKLWFFKIDYFSFDLIDIFYFLLIIFSIVFNLLFCLTTAIFVLLVLTLLLHRLLWPVLARPVYALQRFGIAKRSKLLGTIGLLMVVAVFGKTEWLEKMIDKISPF